MRSPVSAPIQVGALLDFLPKFQTLPNREGARETLFERRDRCASQRCPGQPGAAWEQRGVVSLQEAPAEQVELRGLDIFQEQNAFI